MEGGFGLMAGSNGYHRWERAYGFAIDINAQVLQAIRDLPTQDAAVRVEVVVKVGNLVKEMTLREFLEALQFPAPSQEA